jgi:competence protein ComEC
LKRRLIYLAILIASLYFGSLALQVSMLQPETTWQAASDFKVVTVGFCIKSQTGEKWTISIQGGELSKGSVGLLASKNNQFQIGDCLTGRLQLSPVVGFSRFAFKAALKEVIGPVHHAENLAFINSMRKFAASFEGDSANLVSGLAIGVDQGLSKSFIVNMKTTGLTHLTAVSGANCAIVLAAFWFLGKRLRLGRNLRFLASIVALASYVELVGPQPSVLRAAFMMSVILAAMEFGRRVWVPAALALGSSILLICDPWLIADYGFWLSVLATLGLVLLTPAIALRLEIHLPKPIAIGLAATLAAQLWCLPLLATLQGGFTTYSILANVLVEPLVAPITLLGLLAAVIGPIFPILGSLFMITGSFLASWIVFVANSLSQGPISLVKLPTDGIGLLLIALFVLATSIAILKRRFKALLISASLALVWLGTSAGGALPKMAWPIKNWDVVACDVGQGDSMVIRNHGKIAVIDVGKDPELVDDCLDRLGIAKIDLLVLTHFDFDHVGGLSGAERGRTIELALVSPFPEVRPAAVFMKRELIDVASQVVEAGPGLSGDLAGLNWTVFSSLGSGADSANQGSLGIRFENREMVVYTLADLDERAQSEAVLAVSPSSKPTIVKVSHHGSADQSPVFYQRIKADIALISVGVGNPYGHPTSKILGILNDAGAQVFRTDKQGAVSVDVNQGVIEALVAGAR